MRRARPCILGAKLAGLEPTGTVPHALFLIMGDTVAGALAYHRIMPPDAPRTILVDTFKDEAEESLRVAEALGDALQTIRLDTPGERGGVTAGLVREVRARLDQAGFPFVRILVSGGLNPDRIRELAAAGADSLWRWQLHIRREPHRHDDGHQGSGRQALGQAGAHPGANPKSAFAAVSLILDSPPMDHIIVPVEGPGWRNWQTRTVEGRVGNTVRVQVSSRAPYKG